MAGERGLESRIPGHALNGTPGARCPCRARPSRRRIAENAEFIAGYVQAASMECQRSSTFRNDLPTASASGRRLKGPSALALPPPPYTSPTPTFGLPLPQRLSLSAPPLSPSTAYTSAFGWSTALKSISEAEPQPSEGQPHKRHHQKRAVIQRSQSSPKLLLISTTTTKPFHTHPPRSVCPAASAPAPQC